MSDGVTHKIIACVSNHMGINPRGARVAQLTNPRKNIKTLELFACKGFLFQFLKTFFHLVRFLCHTERTGSPQKDNPLSHIQGLLEEQFRVQSLNLNDDPQSLQ